MPNPEPAHRRANQATLPNTYAPLADSAEALVRGVRKITALRANALGDLIFCLPALDALRAAYPEAEIVLLATEWHREFRSALTGCSRVRISSSRTTPARTTSRVPCARRSSGSSGSVTP
jgi:hypothetical protein